MSTSSVTFNLYGLSSEYEDQGIVDRKIKGTLAPYIKGKEAPADFSDDDRIQMQYLKEYDGGRVICGIMRKFRSDAPAIAKIGETQERFADLDADEFYTEKTHFLYDRRRRIVLYQNNSLGVTHNVFSRYMSKLAGFSVNLASVLTKRAYEMFLNEGELELVRVMFKMARPTCVAMIKKAKNQFSNSVMSVLDTSGGQFVKMEFSGNMRKSGNKEKFLKREFFAFVRLLRDSLIGSQDTGKVKFHDPESGSSQEVDLIQDKFKVLLSTDEVQSVTETHTGKKYINSDKLFGIMRKKMKASEPELEEIFGPV